MVGPTTRRERTETLVLAAAVAAELRLSSSNDEECEDARPVKLLSSDERARCARVTAQRPSR